MSELENRAGIPSRLAITIGGAVFCVFVEVRLKQVGALTWDECCRPWLVFLFGCFHFFTFLFWVHVMDTIKKTIITVGII